VGHAFEPLSLQQEANRHPKHARLLAPALGILAPLHAAFRRPIRCAVRHAKRVSVFALWLGWTFANEEKNECRHGEQKQKYFGHVGLRPPILKWKAGWAP
jgi:hypothetical protein